MHDVPEALRLHDLELHVMVGDWDDPETYRNLNVDEAALIALTGGDVMNTNVRLYRS